MNKFINESKRQFTIDKVLLLVLLGLASFSIAGIYASAPLLNGGQDAANGLIKQQIFWFGVGIGVIIFLIKFGIDRIFSLVNYVYIILMIALLGLLIPKFGIAKPGFIPLTNGIYGWYRFPFASFQPSEFMKICLVIMAANTITKHNAEKTDQSFKSDFQLIAKIAVFALPPLILILLQPDTGIPIVIIISLAVMFMLSGVRKEWFIIVGTIAIGSLLGIVFLYNNYPEILGKMLGGGSTGYRLDRFYGWLDYEKYANTHGYQLFRALISYGTAGFTGHPIGELIAPFPEAQTDFIFAVISNYYGFIGGASVILLSIAFDIRVTQITLKSDLNRERHMMMGVLGMIVFQQVENIGMIMAILPITGITLPFVSYGGSSIVSYMIALAVVFYMHSETTNRHKH